MGGIQIDGAVSGHGIKGRGRGTWTGEVCNASLTRREAFQGGEHEASRAKDLIFSNHVPGFANF
jgi:hypothetical protein